MIDTQELLKRRIAAIGGLRDEEIEVEVARGIATLRGSVTGHIQKLAAEALARGTPGVRAVESRLRILSAERTGSDDTALAREVKNRLSRCLLLSGATLRVTAQCGWIRLAGDVKWRLQRSLAERLVQRSRGVRGVVDQIRVHPRVGERDLQRRVQAAVFGRGTDDRAGLTVQIDGSTVHLRGSVGSRVARDSAEILAWFTPGITTVYNRLEAAPGAGKDSQAEHQKSFLH